MGFVRFLHAHISLFMGEHAHLRPKFLNAKKKHGPCVHDAQTIFLFPTIILLAEVATHFLLLAHRCSLVPVCSLILAALFSFLAG